MTSKSYEIQACSNIDEDIFHLVQDSHFLWTDIYRAYLQHASTFTCNLISQLSSSIIYIYTSTRVSVRAPVHTYAPHWRGTDNNFHWISGIKKGFIICWPFLLWIPVPILAICYSLRGTRQHSWLRHYATSRNIAGSIANEVIQLFNLPNASNRT
jgi:hypothetical protein